MFKLHDMMDKHAIEDIAERLAGLLPPQVGPVRDELRANFRSVLQSQLARLDLVPREEFDATRDMLAETRAKLERLEQQVAALEAREQSEDNDS